MSTSTSVRRTGSGTSSERFFALVLLLGVLQGSGCAARVSGRRFENAEPVWRVDDRRPIPRPAELRSAHNAEEMRDARAPLLHVLRVPGRVPARGVNSLDEVPDSTWFENRIGLRPMSADEVARGPVDGRGPVPPFVVRSMKSAGHGRGIRISDALGVPYLLKFDTSDAPEVETAIDPVVQRLLWASGYHVPADSVVIFPREELVLAEDAERTREDGAEVPMTEDDLEALLATTWQPSSGGTLRAVASEVLPGAPIGGYPVEGVRADDPNDRIPHERRRDVRGQLTFFAWLGHTDAKVDNTLDVWVPRERGDDHGHVVHYLVDFGLALGAKGRRGYRPHDGYAYDFDLGWGVASIATLGLYRRPWERLEPSTTTELGRYEATTFDPARFRPTRPYVPFLFADRFDAYWASKILIRFERSHIEAAVAQGRFSDPAVRGRLVDAIVARQRRTARHWFGEVAPIDYFRVVRGAPGDSLCAEDLLLRYGLEDGAAATTRYRVESFDYDGVPLGAAVSVTGRDDGHVCIEAPRPPARHAGYVMVRYTAIRGGRELPPVVAHLARHPRSGVLRLIGIDRR